MIDETEIQFHEMLGRSPLLDESKACGFWELLLTSRFFQRERINGDFWQAVFWYVDRLPSLLAFNDASIGASTFPKLRSCTDERMWGMLDRRGCLEAVGVQGILEGYFGDLRTDLSLTLGLLDPAYRSVPVGPWVAECGFRPRWREGLSVEDEFQQYSRISRALGIEEAIELTRHEEENRYIIKQREPGGNRTIYVAFSREDSGQLAGGITVGVRDVVELRTLVEAVFAQWPQFKHRWCTAGFHAPNPAAWEEARPWLAEQHDGVWQLSGCLTAREVWTPARFSTRDSALDWIPAGRLVFPRRGTTARTLPNPLRGVHLLVDLCKEGDGWHFAFHLLEEKFSRIKRENIRRTLNSFMGFDLVTRTPESLWPAAFPS